MFRRKRRKSESSEADYVISQMYTPFMSVFVCVFMAEYLYVSLSHPKEQWHVGTANSFGTLEASSALLSHSHPSLSFHPSISLVLLCFCTSHHSCCFFFFIFLHPLFLSLLLSLSFPVCFVSASVSQSVRLPIFISGGDSSVMAKPQKNTFFLFFFNFTRLINYFHISVNIQ